MDLRRAFRGDKCCICSVRVRGWLAVLLVALLLTPPLASLGAQAPEPARAQEARHAGGEANLILPDLGQVTFQGINGRTLLMGGLVVCVLGLLFGLVIFVQLKNLPVHRSMREISELIYETCKTYLITQGKFILILELFIGVIMVFYFGVPAALRRGQGRHHPALQPDRHRRQLRRGLVRHPRQHLRQLARRVRRPARASRSRSTRSRCRPA